MLKGNSQKVAKSKKITSGPLNSQKTLAKNVKKKKTTLLTTPIASISTSPSHSRLDQQLSDPVIAKKIPANIQGESYKDPLLNQHPHHPHHPHHPNSPSTTFANITTKLKNTLSTGDLYEDFNAEKYGDAGLHIDENLYDVTKTQLQQKIVTKPLNQLQPLINVLLPKDSPLDEYSYLRIRKMAKLNPDLIAMNENKLNSRLLQLSKIVLHPTFYTEYSSRYVFKKHGIDAKPPEDSVMNDKMQKYLKKKAQDLENGINNPSPQMEQSLRNYKKIHQYPYHPLVLHVFEKFPLVLRRKHIENTPELIEKIFTTIQSDTGAEALYQDIGDYDDDVGYKPLNQSNVINFRDVDHFDQKNHKIDQNDSKNNQNQHNSLQNDEENDFMSSTLDNFNKSGSKGSGKRTNNVHIDPYSILGRFPKLLELDLTNKIHDKINSFTTIICAFLAQDDPTHNNLYTREDITNAQQLVLHFVVSQPDILQANVHNIIPKRLNFIQKACLFNSASETLRYLIQHPRLLSPTIPPSNIQRLSLLRLKPPRFDHLNEEMVQKLGFEAKFALDMVQKFSQLTPYPELSKVDSLLALLKNGRRAERAGKKKNEVDMNFEEFATNFKNGSFNDFNPNEPISVHQHNEIESRYHDCDVSWGEYLEMMSNDEEFCKKWSKALEPSQNQQPKSFESLSQKNSQKNLQNSQKDLHNSPDSFEMTSQNDQIDDKIALNNDLLSKSDSSPHQLKLNMIPLLVLMHGKTFNSIFPEFSQAKKKSSQHRQQPLSSPTQYNRFLDQSNIVTQTNQDAGDNGADLFTDGANSRGDESAFYAQKDEIDPFGVKISKKNNFSSSEGNFINTNNYKNFSVESLDEKGNTVPKSSKQHDIPMTNSQLKKKMADERLDEQIFTNMKEKQRQNAKSQQNQTENNQNGQNGPNVQKSKKMLSQNDAENDDYTHLPEEEYDYDFATSPRGVIDGKLDANGNNVNELRRKERALLSRNRHPNDLDKEFAREDERDSAEYRSKQSLNDDDSEYGEPFDNNLNGEDRYFNRHGDKERLNRVLSSLRDGSTSSRPSSDSASSTPIRDIDDIHDGNDLGDEMDSLKGKQKLAPIREIVDSFQLDPDAVEKFTLSAQKTSQRDHSREKMHRYKGKGAQFHDMDGAKTVEKGFEEDFGEFGSTLNRKNNQFMMDAMKNVATQASPTSKMTKTTKTTQNAKTTASGYNPIEEAADKVDSDAFKVEQVKYIHKNKLQKEPIRTQRKLSTHEESDLEQEIKFYSPDEQQAEQIGQNIHEIEQKMKEKGEKILGPAGADIILSSPSSRHSDKISRKTAGINSTAGTGRYKDEEEEFVLYGVDVDELMEGDYAPPVMTGVSSKTPVKNINAESIVKQREEIDEKKKEEKKVKKIKRFSPSMTEYETKWAGGAKRGGQVM